MYISIQRVFELIRLQTKKHQKLILLVVGFIIISIRLPYRSYSLSQFLIPPSYSDSSNSAFFLSSILQFAWIIMIIKEFMKSQFRTNKFLIVLIMIFILPPHVSNMQSVIYKLHDGVKSIEVTENYIDVFESDPNFILYSSFDLKSYGDNDDLVELYIEIPRDIQEAYEISNVLDKKIYLSKYSEKNVNYEIELVPKDTNSEIDINLIRKSFRNYQIILKQGEDEAKWRLRMFQ